MMLKTNILKKLPVQLEQVFSIDYTSIGRCVFQRNLWGRVFSLLLLLGSSGLVLFTQKAQAQEGGGLDDLLSLSIEDLRNVEVTSVSRKPENQFRAASAVTVLTDDDIKRSGATSIADALRLVPGLNVARIDSSRWAITSRGFNRQFSNKLLVLIDGRSVYTPLFSGVFWDVQDTNLADIDRIEVIRGSGATMWGANAVNGIINIITKNAEFTQGNSLSVLYGNTERGTATVRRGGQMNDDTFYRVYGKYLAREESRNLTSTTGNDDSWYSWRTGFRTDWSDLDNSVRLSGDMYTGRVRAISLIPGLTTPGVSDAVDADEVFHGANLTGAWTYNHKSGAESILQAYVDYIERDVSNLLDQERITFDLDYQRRQNINDRNELIWGLGYRYFRDDLENIRLANGQLYLHYVPDSSDNNTFSSFIQNEWAAIPDELYLTLGSKFEHNFFTDFEVQPNARVAWYPSDNQTVWAAVSHAVRVPTRGERGLSSIALSTPGGFVRLSASADRNFTSEELTAFELGYRVQPTQWASFDASAFYNIYDDLRTFEPGSSNFGNPNTLSELIAENLGSAETFGFELGSLFSVTPTWDIGVNYTFLELQMHSDKRSLDFTIAGEEDKSPEHQIAITSRLDITPEVQFDNNLYYVDSLENFGISDYLRFDTRIGWEFSPGLEVSLVGQDLLDDYHQEFEPFLFSQDAEIGRSVFVKFNVNL